MQQVDQEKVSPEVEDAVWLAAERGWRVEVEFKDGEKFGAAFITATDEASKVVVMERPGERQKPPRIVHLKDLSSAKVIWQKPK